MGFVLCPKTELLPQNCQLAAREDAPVSRTSVTISPAISSSSTLRIVFTLVVRFETPPPFLETLLGYEYAFVAAIL
jgi:hypothetical protein